MQCFLSFQWIFWVQYKLTSTAFMVKCWHSKIWYFFGWHTVKKVRVTQLYFYNKERSFIKKSHVVLPASRNIKAGNNIIEKIPADPLDCVWSSVSLLKYKIIWPFYDMESLSLVEMACCITPQSINLNDVYEYMFYLIWACVLTIFSKDTFLPYCEQKIIYRYTVLHS